MNETDNKKEFQITGPLIDLGSYLWIIAALFLAYCRKAFTSWPEIKEDINELEERRFNTSSSSSSSSFSSETNQDHEAAKQLFEFFVPGSSNPDIQEYGNIPPSPARYDQQSARSSLLGSPLMMHQRRASLPIPWRTTST